jgi:hypothetical protein
VRVFAVGGDGPYGRRASSDDLGAKENDPEQVLSGSISLALKLNTIVPWSEA